MRTLILFGYVAFLLAFLVHFIDGNGYMTVKFKSYVNSKGNGANRHCCDGKWGICQANGCDHMFTFCINDYIINDDHMESAADCNLLLERSSEIENQNSINFGSDIGGLSNPVILEFVSSPMSLQIKVLVYDKDDFLDEINKNEFVDYLRADITQTMLAKTYREGGQDFILSSRTELVLNIHSICGADFYGPRCTVQCLPPASGQHYRCDPTTGKKVCEDGWYGDVCDREYCATMNCLNGATCTHANDQAFCVCTDGFSGTHCELAEVPFCKEYCGFGVCEIVNRATQTYICHCYDGAEVSQASWGQTCLPTTTTSTTTTTVPTTTTEAPVYYVDRSNADCDSLAASGFRYQDGIYTLQPAQSAPFRAYCDMSAEGWTVIQRRPRTGGDVSFDRTWDEYKVGFGEPGPTTELWLGLDKIYYLTNQRRYKLLVTLRVADGTFRTVEYEHFYIESESNGYRLHVAGADGNAGDALGATAAARNVANGMMFSTPDRDNDNKDNFNCAQETNSGWWMNYCSGSNLNGEFKDSTGLGWAECYRGHCMQWSTVPAPFDTKALMASEMKIMPNKDYEPYYPEGQLNPF